MSRSHFNHPSDPSHFDNLPDELNMHILSYLKNKNDRKNAARANDNLRRLTKDKSFSEGVDRRFLTNDTALVITKQAGERSDSYVIWLEKNSEPTSKHDHYITADQYTRIREAMHIGISELYKTIRAINESTRDTDQQSMQYLLRAFMYPPEMLLRSKSGFFSRLKNFTKEKAKSMTNVFTRHSL